MNVLIPSEEFSKAHSRRISEVIPGKVLEGIHGTLIKRLLDKISDEILNVGVVATIFPVATFPATIYFPWLQFITNFVLVYAYLGLLTTQGIFLVLNKANKAIWELIVDWKITKFGCEEN